MDRYDLSRLSDDELGRIAGEPLTPRQRQERAGYLASVAAEMQRRGRQRQVRLDSIQAPLDKYQRAMEAAQDVPSPGPRTWSEWVWSGGPAKDERVRHADAQRAAFVKTLGTPPEQGPLYPDATDEERAEYERVSQALERLQGLRATALSNNNPKALAALEGPSDSRWVVLPAVGNYWQAMPALGYNAILAAQGDPQAVKDGRAAASTLLGPLAEHHAEAMALTEEQPLVRYQPGFTDLIPFVGTDGYGDWIKSQPDRIVQREISEGLTNARREKAAREADNRLRANWRTPWSKALQGLSDTNVTSQSEPMMGETFYEKQGFSPGVALGLGLATDTLADPLASGFKAPAQVLKAFRYASPAAKAARYRRAAGLLGEDFGPPAVLMGGAAAAQGFMGDPMNDPVVQYYMQQQ